MREVVRLWVCGSLSLGFLVLVLWLGFLRVWFLFIILFMEGDKEQGNINSEAYFSEKDPAKWELDQDETPETCKKVLNLIESSGYPFVHHSHKPVKTSAEAAEERGVDLSSGAKALLVKYSTKTDKALQLFALLVMSASKKVSWTVIRSHLNSKNVSFAKVEEVKAVTGCIPGAVPPFGSLFNAKTLLDPSLKKQGEKINFNCGLRSQSLCLKTEDYLKIERPEELNFAED